MSKKFENIDTYNASVDALWAMLSDKQYWEDKYAAMGATDFEWKTFNAADDTLTVSSSRKVDANLPSAAKKIVGDKAEVTQTENWRREGDSLVCDISILTKGAPGGTTGQMRIEPSGTESRWSADFTISINIPLLGKKLEGVMYDETSVNFATEKEFNDRWLRAT